MNQDTRDLVHRLVGARTEIDAASIGDADRLEDLGLVSLDVLLLVLRLEDLDPGQGEFPVSALVRAETVGDLVLLVDLWRQRDTLRALPEDSSPRSAA